MPEKVDVIGTPFNNAIERVLISSVIASSPSSLVIIIHFIGADIFLSPEMHSTGEVMGMDTSKGLAYLKSQIAAGGKLPESGNIFVSLNNKDKERAVPYLKDLAELGFNIYATEGTSTMLYDNNIKSNAIFKISKGRPNLVDLLNENKIQWIIMTREDGEEILLLSLLYMVG